MLPASDLTEIIANLAALNLEASTAAAVLGALAPLLRTTETPPAVLEPQPSRRPRSSKRSRGSPRRKYKRCAPRSTEAHDRALAVLRDNPDATTTALAKLANCSRSTILNTRKDLAVAERKAARAPATPIGGSKSAKPAARRARAQEFLKHTLVGGPKRVSDVEEAAAKAHVDPTALEQARADLGIVVSRSNTGGVQAVQWSLPG